MALRAQAVTVDTTVGGTLLNNFADMDGVFGNTVAISVASGTVYVGPSGVTSSSGFPVASGTPVGFDLKPGDAVYAVTASGSVTVNVLATGV